LLTEHRPQDDAYSSARAFAARGRLLTRSELETLAESRDLEDLAGRLRGTVYAEQVSAVTRPYTPVKLEKALRASLAQLHYRLSLNSPDKAILDAYYNRFIVWNLKIILRSKALGLESSEITQQVDLYPEELIGRRDIIAKALSGKDLKETVEQLGGTEFGDDVAKALALYNEKKELQVFDVLLERALFNKIIDAYNSLKSAPARRLSDELSRIEDILGYDVDGYNITTSLRAKAWGLTIPQARALLIERSFMLRPRDLEAMLQADSVSEAAKILQFTPYRQLLSGADESLIQMIERGFNRLALQVYRRAFTGSIFGVPVVLSMLKLKEEEVRNISLIIFGVHQGMGSREIMTRLEFTSPI